MPLYAYKCSGCGPFERRSEGAAEAGATCPSCGAHAVRIFNAPGGRAPRRQRQLEGMSGSNLRRVDRAQSGASAIGELPAGVRLDGAGRPRVKRSSKDDRRPWQLGH